MFTWVILRWLFRKSPSTLSGPAILERTRRSSNGLAMGRYRPWTVHASSVRSSLSTIRSRVYRPSTAWRALIPPIRRATTGAYCSLSRRTRARSSWRGPTWSRHHQEATCLPAGGRRNALCTRSMTLCIARYQVVGVRFLFSLKRWKRLLIVLALGVVFFDDLLANHAAADLRASAFLEGLGLLGVARGRCLPARLISEGPCATDGRSTLSGLSRVPGCVSGVFATFG